MGRISSIDVSFRNKRSNEAEIYGFLQSVWIALRAILIDRDSQAIWKS